MTNRKPIWLEMAPFGYFNPRPHARRIGMRSRLQGMAPIEEGACGDFAGTPASPRRTLFLVRLMFGRKGACADLYFGRYSTRVENKKLTSGNVEASS